MIAAIFDLDGTLYTGHITKGIVRHHQLHKVKRLPLYAYLVVHLPLGFLHRAGLLSEAAMRDLWVRDLGWTLWHWTPQEAQAAFAWLADQYVVPLLRPDVMARLREHQAAGHRVILVSGTFDPLLAEIGRRLGVEDTVGTPLVVRKGRYTGASELPACQGRHKVTRLERYLRGSDDIAWPESYAYADSHTDIPLLEKVGHPVATYPDAELAAHARRQGWEIMGQVQPSGHAESRKGVSEIPDGERRAEGRGASSDREANRDE